MRCPVKLHKPRAFTDGNGIQVQNATGRAFQKGMGIRFSGYMCQISQAFLHLHSYEEDVRRYIQA